LSRKLTRNNLVFYSFVVLRLFNEYEVWITGANTNISAFVLKCVFVIVVLCQY